MCVSLRQCLNHITDLLQYYIYYAPQGR